MAPQVAAAAPADLANTLSNIRRLNGSKLAHQAKPAQLLIAIEETLKASLKNEAGPPFSSTAYFASLVSCLADVKEVDVSEGGLTSATLYLMAPVISDTPKQVISNQIPSLLPKLEALFDPCLAHPPALRSLIQILTTIFIAAPTNPSPLLRRAFNHLLELNLDGRPKVRHLAQEGVRKALTTPIPPKAIAGDHPYLPRARQWAMDVLKEQAASSSSSSSKRKVRFTAADDADKTPIWVIQGLRGWISIWEDEHIAELCSVLLALPPSPHLTPQVYSLLSILLQPEERKISNVSTILTALLGSPAPVVEYIDAVVAATIKSGESYLSRSWNALWALMEKSKPDVQRQASDGLAQLIRFCVSKEMVAAAQAYADSGAQVDTKRQKSKPPVLTRMIAQLDASPLLLPYTMPIMVAVIRKTRNTLMLPLVIAIADLRTQPDFQEKEKVDEVVGAAIEVMKVKTVLEVLPLNIGPKDPKPGRAHLLPLMRAHITNDHLSYFTSNLVPLSEQLFDLKTKAATPMQAKVWEVLISQIWDTLPGFMDLARDVREAFNPQFAQLLAQLLYSQGNLRAAILRGLTNVITSTQSLAKSSATDLVENFGIDQQDAAQTLTHVRGMANEMLAVLFNVFSTVDLKGQVGEVIGVWLSIMEAKDIELTYTKVAAHLGTAMTNGNKAVTHTMLDLLIILVPFLPATSARQLFSAASSATLVENADPAVQKKSYRILSKLFDLNKAVLEDVDGFVARIVEAGAKIGVGAQRDRVLLLTSLVPAIPENRLHLMPSVITEAVLSTKEANEKARNAAFDLLIVLAEKMAAGGTIQQKLLGEDMEDAADVPASIPEYITMVAAGLAGTTPHMISATITALARLAFEYYNMLSELIQTVIVFLNSKNREIVKSALGFAKVAVVALPEDAIRPHLPQLVPALLGWVHDHKNHFKLKTVHIFERMIRKFGYDEVYGHAGDTDAKKVLEHIKKKKDRQKRQRAKRAEEGDEEDTETPRQTTGSAFEDALYGSDSESEDDRPAQKNGSASVKSSQGAFIQEDEDEPMDLLDRSIAGKVTRFDPSASKKRRQPGQDAAAFKTDDDGRMVIEESEDEDEPAPGPSRRKTDEDVEGTAYLTAQTSVDGIVRDGRGRLKFNKNTKKGRALEEENILDDDIMDDGPQKKQKRKADKLGGEFKSRRAGGDIKRQNGPDPFAYVPLNRAGKQKGGSGRINLTNKKRGSGKI